jgi:hypothetical protein
MTPMSPSLPSEGAEAHRGWAAVESFFGRIYAGPKRYSWQWQDRWVWAEGTWGRRSSLSAMSSSKSREQNDSSFPIA